MPLICCTSLKYSLHFISNRMVILFFIHLNIKALLGAFKILLGPDQISHYMNQACQFIHNPTSPHCSRVITMSFLFELWTVQVNHNNISLMWIGLVAMMISTPRLAITCNLKKSCFLEHQQTIHGSTIQH